MRKTALVLCLLPITLLQAEPVAPGNSEDAVLRQIQLVNQIPEDQLNEKTDPGFSILRTLYDQDGPDFLTLRKLLGQANVRSTLNPSAKCLLAGVISQRWDTFTLSGNLYLAGLQSKNTELRDKARKKLVAFIQPAHIPALIDLLRVPGPNVMAYDLLQEVSGQRIDPNAKSWQKWWAKNSKTADLIGHLIGNTRTQLGSGTVHAFDQDRFWYVPQGITNTMTPFAERPAAEQTRISDWNAWVHNDVKRYVDEWAVNKPIIDRLIHQPDPRVNQFLESLVPDPGMGDYASVVLGWRSSAGSVDAIRSASQTTPTVGRFLARGSLGDKTALNDLLQIIEKHQSDPLTYKLMDDDARSMLTTLRTVGVISAEQAFQLLAHTNFEFESARTAKEKKKAYKKAKAWLKDNESRLTLDHRRGFYTVTPTAK